VLVSKYEHTLIDHVEHIDLKCCCGLVERLKLEKCWLY